MPANKTADPVDILDIIRGFGKETKDAIKDAAITIRNGILEARSSTEHVTANLTLAPYSPVVLLGYDRARTRALVQTSTSNVHIGTLQQLSGGLGFELQPFTGGQEIMTVDEVYVAYLPPTPTGEGKVNAWIERRP